MVGLAFAIVSAMAFLMVWDTALPGSPIDDGNPEVLKLSEKIEEVCNDVSDSKKGEISLKEGQKVVIEGKQIRLEYDEKEESFVVETSCGSDQDIELQSTGYVITKSQGEQYSIEKTG